MKKLPEILIVGLSLLTFGGCFPEDVRIDPHPRNEISIPYSLYTYQCYFDLEKGNIVAHHHFTDWDLGFESSDTGYHVILNYARFMLAGNSGVKDFNAVTSAEGVTLQLDASSGNLDSTAIGEWGDFQPSVGPVSYRYIYVIHRGNDENGNDFGYKKLQLGDYTSSGYTIRFANLDGTDEHTATIPKDTTVRFVLFSFDDSGSSGVHEPPKKNWDLCFTKYSTILYQNDTIPTPYLVRGVYINPGHVSVASENHIPFDQITFALSNEYTFSRAQDAIGYDWKVYEDGAYHLVEGLTYLIRLDNGSLFKLRFTSFHNDQGVRGYPSFELARLN